MGVSEILEHIDREIAQLTHARAILAGTAPKVGRPAGSGKPGPKPKKKRNLSPEGRRRIAEAVRRRWAEQKKATAES